MPSATAFQGDRPAKRATSVKPIRIGIVGCGNVLGAYWPQAQRLALRGLAEVVAACGRPTQRDLVVNQLGVRRFVTDHGDLLAMSDVDLVLVLTPAPSHFDISRAALQAGKHVVTEKPLALVLDEAAAAGGGWATVRALGCSPLPRSPS